MEKYRVVATKVVEDDVTGQVIEEEVVVNEEYDGFAMLGKCLDGRMNEVVIHENLAEIASMLASGSHMQIACKLANIMLDMKKSRAGGLEDLLLDAIMDGKDD